MFDFLRRLTGFAERPITSSQPPNDEEFASMLLDRKSEGQWRKMQRQYADDLRSGISPEERESLHDTQQFLEGLRRDSAAWEIALARTLLPVLDRPEAHEDTEVSNYAKSARSPRKFLAWLKMLEMVSFKLICLYSRRSLMTRWMLRNLASRLTLLRDR